jgi:nucleoid-associated protein Lsr2
VTFALDTTAYEIDLSDDKAGQLGEAFARYIKAARKVSSSAGRRGARAAKPAYSG